MLKKIVFLAIFFVIVLPNRCVAFSAKKIDCKFLGSAPVIDANINEDRAWDKTEWQKGDFIFLGNSSEYMQQTKFKIGYNTQGLFIAVICYDPEASKIISRFKDSESVWDDDSIEVFIMPDPKAEQYFQFIVNAEGYRYNGIERTSYKIWQWKAKTKINKDFWCAEIVIPFEIFSLMPEKDKIWGFNICRNIKIQDHILNSSWSEMQDSFHEPQNFAKLYFEKTLLRPNSDTKQKEGKKFVLYCKPSLGLFLLENKDRKISLRNSQWMAPRLSPDGESFVFQTLRNGKMEIWVSDIDCKDQKRICDGEQAQWSGDANSIIFELYGKIFKKNLGSGDQECISPQNFNSCFYPSYFSDNKLMFVSKDQNTDKIFLMPFDPSGTPVYLVSGEIKSAPKASIQGLIAFQDGAHIFLFDPKTNETRQITYLVGIQSYPMWSSDGKSISYHQTYEDSADIFDICNTSLDSPGQAELIVSKCGNASEWSDWWTPVRDKDNIKTGNLVFWQTNFLPKTNFEQKEYEKFKKTNQLLPITGKNSKISNDVLFAESEWGLLFIRKGGYSFDFIPKKMCFQEKDEFLTDIKFLFFDKMKKPLKIRSINMAGQDPKFVFLNVLFENEEKDSAALVLSVSKYRPIFEIKNEKNIETVLVKKDFNFGLISDRFSNDLIVLPQKEIPSKILLPYAPFILAGIKSEGFLMFSSRDKDQIITIKRQNEKNIFNEIEISNLKENKSFFVAELMSDQIWQELEIKKDLSIDFPNIFPAFWRLSVSGPLKNYSIMLDRESISKVRNSSVVEGNFVEENGKAVIYVYSRDRNTPVDFLTPMDILYDIYGINGTRELLDVSGIRGYRVSNAWFPIHELMKPDTNRLWGEQGWPKDLDFSPIFVLMEKIRNNNRKGVPVIKEDLNNDVIGMIRGLDLRIMEYEAFLNRFDDFCKTEKNQCKVCSGYFEDFENEAEKTIAKIKGAEFTEIKKIEAGSGNYSQFSKLSALALSERKFILNECRSFVKSTREMSGKLIMLFPENKKIFENIREMAQGILRNRHYFEGDWRGENP